MVPSSSFTHMTGHSGLRFTFLARACQWALKKIFQTTLDLAVLTYKCIVCGSITSSSCKFSKSGGHSSHSTVPKYVLYIRVNQIPLKTMVWRYDRLGLCATIKKVVLNLQRGGALAAFSKRHKPGPVRLGPRLGPRRSTDGE